MIAANVKDLIDTIASVGTVVGFITAGFLWYVSRRDSQAKGKAAIEQINLMATNHFPHMQADLATIVKESTTTNELLRQLQLGQVETNTILRK